MASSVQEDNSTDSYKKVTEQFPKETNYKQRLSKTGRKSAKDGWKTTEEIDGVIDYCLMCGCQLCSQGLPKAQIVFYGFPEMDCSYYVRSLQK